MAFITVLLLVLLASIALAAPTDVSHREPGVIPGLPDGIINSQDALNSALSMASKLGGSAFESAIPSIFSAIQPSATPSSVDAAISALKAVHSASPINALNEAADVLLSGLATLKSPDSLPCNSFNNKNKDPPKSIYPAASTKDPHYGFSEDQLRSAIHIPNGFKGKSPLIFIPGTGVTGCETYTPNYAKILADSPHADPVFLNVPTRMLDDEQNNAEFIAYAINYISQVGGGNVSIMAYSGGNTATQWALKYWPSARQVVTDYLAIAPDYHGTKLIVELCLPGSPCPPSVLQQAYGSTFTRTLLNNGGDSAFVPTTASWSIFDENIEPQQGTGASAYLKGATHNQIQNTCGPGTAAGAPVPGHEGVLYNAEAAAVSLDALAHDGPGEIKRSGASGACGSLVAKGLDLNAILGTEALQPIAALNVNTYAHKATKEPAIKPYAQKDVPK